MGIVKSEEMRQALISMTSMQALRTYMEEKRRVIDAALNAEIPGEDVRPSLLHKAMRYSVFSGGKRLRPVICLAAAEAAGASWEVAILPAAALELLHTYTLIHDDLPSMDNDDSRRGKPTCHVAFGEANAILAGDALQALAFSVAARAPVPPGYPPNTLALELARAAGSQGVVGGQVEDLNVESEDLDDSTLQYVHLHKTAELFRTAVRMGGVAAGAKEPGLAALSEYGVNVGLAFQRADDVLDKGSGDSRHEFTCLDLWTPEEAAQMAREAADRAIAALECFPEPERAVLAAIARYAVERTH